MKQCNFEKDLQKHLWKCELEYRAEHLPGGSNVDWLAPFCESTQQIAAFLRDLGFKICEIIDEVDCAGDPHQWVETTSGVLVCVNQNYMRGLIIQSGRVRRKRNAEPSKRKKAPAPL